MPGRQRGVSTSSMRTSQRPPCARASSQLASAATSDPACSGPVGEGAKRPVTAAGARRPVTAAAAKRPAVVVVPERPASAAPTERLSSGPAPAIYAVEPGGGAWRSSKAWRVVGMASCCSHHCSPRPSELRTRRPTPQRHA